LDVRRVVADFGWLGEPSPPARTGGKIKGLLNKAPATGGVKQ
jgi:hypothetical protein